MFRKLLLVTIAATGLALVGLTDTANADHERRRSRHDHHHGFRGGYGAFCPDYGHGYGRGFGRGFYGSPFDGGYGRGFYRQPAFSGYRNYGIGGSGLYIQGRNFGFGFSRW